MSHTEYPDFDHLEEALQILAEARTDRMEIATLKSALKESLQLQSHYAVLLNRFDAGERMTFPTVESWLDRLRMIGKLPKDKP